MKIRFLDRLILFLGALLTILAGGALFVAGMQLHGVFAENMPAWGRVLCLVGGILCVAFGGYLIVFPRLFSVKRNEFVVQKTDSGELRIAIKAIENLVQKCIDLHEEIDVKSMNILNGREGVVVELNISLANNISIPLAVASLQKQIKQYLAASSGIEVREVRVSVEGTQDEPEIVQEALEAEENGFAEGREKKAPLHQRLFGRADQPAIVPEPPKMEQEEELPVSPEGTENAAEPQDPWLPPVIEKQEAQETEIAENESPEEKEPADAPLFTGAENASVWNGEEPLESREEPETEDLNHE